MEEDLRFTDSFIYPALNPLNTASCISRYNLFSINTERHNLCKQTRKSGSRSSSLLIIRYSRHHKTAHPRLVLPIQRDSSDVYGPRYRRNGEKVRPGTVENLTGYEYNEYTLTT